MAENIKHAAERLSTEAESGRPSVLHEVNKELANDFAKMSASDYGKLLTGIVDANTQHRNENDKLPILDLYENGHTVLPNAISARYLDKTVSSD